MARRMMDAQIFWVVVLGLLFWTAIWKHEMVAELFRKSPIPKVVQWLEGGSTSEK